MSWCGHPGTPRGARSVAAWTGSTVCAYSALSRYCQKDKSNNNKGKTQIGDSTISREHSLISNYNHQDFVCSVDIGSAPNFRDVLVSKYGEIDLISSVSLYPLRHAYMSSTISGHFVGEHSLTSAGENHCSSLINRCDACKRQHIRDWTKLLIF